MNYSKAFALSLLISLAASQAFAAGLGDVTGALNNATGSLTGTAGSTAGQTGQIGATLGNTATSAQSVIQQGAASSVTPAGVRLGENIYIGESAKAGVQDKNLYSQAVNTAGHQSASGVTVKPDGSVILGNSQTAGGLNTQVQAKDVKAGGNASLNNISKVQVDTKKADLQVNTNTKGAVSLGNSVNKPDASPVQNKLAKQVESKLTDTKDKLTEAVAGKKDELPKVSAPKVDAPDAGAEKKQQAEEKISDTKDKLKETTANPQQKALDTGKEIGHGAHKKIGEINPAAGDAITDAHNKLPRVPSQAPKLPAQQ